MDAVFWDLAAMPGAALAPWKGRAVPQGAGTAAVHPWDVGTRFWVGDMRVTSSKAQPRASKTHHYLVNPEARTSTSESIKKTNHKLAYSRGEPRCRELGAWFFHPPGTEGRSSGSESRIEHCRGNGSPGEGLVPPRCTQDHEHGPAGARPAVRAALEDAAGPPWSCCSWGQAGTAWGKAEIRPGG